MAIYTNYGRYLKAKQFKEMLEDQGETYMLFGLGNPQWDNPDNEQSIPIASYNTEAMTNPDSETANQFYDKDANVWFNTRVETEGSSSETVFTYGAIQSIANGAPISNGGGVKNYAKLCRRLVPPFPCVFTCGNGNNDEIVLRPSTETPDEDAVKQSTYQNYYITKETSNEYRLRSVSGADYTIVTPQDSYIEIQYFTEAYLRVKALKSSNLPSPLRPPVGFLGAIKCNIDFVKDIGEEGSSLYTGSINQFWYGDRYWQIVKPDENELIGDPGGYIETDEEQINQGIYPHHILFNATVNPRTLCEELNIDQYLVPRQIAIFTRKRPFKANTVDGSSYIEADVDENGNYYATYEEGPLYYRANEYIFNFGQYSEVELEAFRKNFGNKILNFTLPCDCGTVEGPGAVALPYKTPNGEFKFLLNDYIRGQVRTRHSVDRFGYVVGF